MVSKAILAIVALTVAAFGSTASATPIANATSNISSPSSISEPAAYYYYYGNGRWHEHNNNSWYWHHHGQNNPWYGGAPAYGIPLTLGLGAYNYGYNGYYNNGYYGYGGDNAHIQWCLARYRSYDPASDTYMGYDGYRHRCGVAYYY